ncbi:uncharacterized protein GGS22DRAFT_156561 [Annulohypoxylon maeteangense]|uniref:uncharacterized protein n=1 Tax=Annulohypoxylon maeteangense TaxID=1927788 RepID=UPI002007D732|nr:uncharacterized protein GGS22DRAFT_156561 [Annulohypoxylon maeteangense]KAI0887254.1 hypothetical protein GGS22DRAFT_156561 [Annulohypoxylon maeteangense]
MDKKKKVVYQLDTPYSAVSWPSVTLEDQETLLEILCALLEPLGRHRSKYIQPSKGQRDKKRKRKAPNTGSKELASPPIPELRTYVDVGLTTVTRHLQEMASKAHGVDSTLEEKLASQETSCSPYSVIFVARSGQSSILNGHFPQMVAVASKSNPSQTPIRLVGLSKSCEDRLSESLCIPRVSCIGLYEGAPNSKALVEFARQHVPPIESHWLQEARQAEYQETTINTIETFIGSKKQSNHRLPKP